MVVYVTQESTNANPIQKIVLKLIQQAFKIRRNNMFPKGVYVNNKRPLKIEIETHCLLVGFCLLVGPKQLGDCFLVGPKPGPSQAPTRP